MAAVFALVFLPALAAIGFMLKATHGQMSAGVAFAATIFVVLAAFVFGGVLRFIQRAEDEAA